MGFFASPLGVIRQQMCPQVWSSWVRKILRGSPSHLEQLLGNAQRQETHSQVPQSASDLSWAPGSPLQMLGCPWMSPGAAKPCPSHPNFPLFPLLLLPLPPLVSSLAALCSQSKTVGLCLGDFVPRGFVSGANPADGSFARHTCPWPDTGVLQGWLRAFAAKL